MRLVDKYQIVIDKNKSRLIRPVNADMYLHWSIPADSSQALCFVREGRAQPYVYSIAHPLKGRSNSAFGDSLMTRCITHYMNSYRSEIHLFERMY